MNNSEIIAFFILGIITGVIILSSVLIFIPGTTTQLGRVAIEKCENTLPRNQHCIITAIPEERLYK